MKFRKTLIGALLSAALLPGVASAANIDWAWNYAGLNAAEGYAPGACPGGGVTCMNPVSANMNELKFTAESLINWTTGAPFAVGSKFDDYILLRIDQYNHNSTNVTEGNYGEGFPGFGIPGNHQFTAKIKLSGTQTGTNTYKVDSMSEFGLYYDSGDGAAYTFADFTPGTEADFSDSTLAETGFLISGNGANTTGGLPDGSIGLVVGLLDNLHNINLSFGTTELLPQGRLFYLPIPLAIGIVDGNNNLCTDDGGTAVCTDTEASLRAYWGLGAVPAGLTFHTRSDGSVNKQLIPEPATLLLFGTALFGLSRMRRTLPV